MNETRFALVRDRGDGLPPMACGEVVGVALADRICGLLNDSE